MTAITRRSGSANWTSLRRPYRTWQNWGIERLLSPMCPSIACNAWTVSMMQRIENAKPRGIQDSQHIRNTLISFCNVSVLPTASSISRRNLVSLVLTTLRTKSATGFLASYVDPVLAIMQSDRLAVVISRAARSFSEISDITIENTVPAIRSNQGKKLYVDANISKADPNWLKIGPATYNTEAGVLTN
jgi:hypothetical protein